jgi:peptidyl-tRNA hydrolase, PTH1 family
MKLIIGLGNPGKEYEKTRHNIGFILLDRIKEAYKFPDFEFNKKFNACISISSVPLLPLGEGGPTYVGPDEGGTKDNQKIILVKPQTLMNNSGQAVKAIMDFYKLPLENLIVIHDDIDIEIGKYKISNNSGSAGHNGIQDIINKLGTQNFKRIRIGVGNADLRSKIDPTDFVLGKFSDEELKTLIDEVSGNILFEIEKLI